MRVAALVAAAGLGGRMGFPKILLGFDDGTLLLARHLGALLEAGCAPLWVTIPPALTAEDAALVHACAARHGATTLPNPTMDLGLWGSVGAVLPSLPADHALCVLPVDTVAVDAAVMRTLLSAAQQHPGTFLRPRVGGRTGHPLFIPAHVVPRLRDPPPQQGLRGLFHHAAPLVDVDIPAQHASCCVDANTPELAAQHHLRRVTSRPAL